MLAIEDHASIVRYWAARLTYIRKPVAEESAAGAFGFLGASTHAERQLYEKANADPCELVRICAQRGETLSYRTLTEEPQFRRLAFLRSSSPDLPSFFEWLGRGIDVGVPDAELAECVAEFLVLPTVRRTLERNPDDFADGGDAYIAGKAIRAGWEVTRKAGRALQRQLAFALPTRMGLLTISVDELAEMPPGVLAVLPWRTDEFAEIKQLTATMRAQPDRFPEEALKSLAGADNTYLPSGDELVDARARHAVDRSRATLDMLIRLGEKVTALTGQLELMQQELSSCKGGLLSR